LLNSRGRIVHTPHATDTARLRNAAAEIHEIAVHCFGLWQPRPR
jgi:hypothetical protein